MFLTTVFSSQSFVTAEHAKLKVYSLPRRMSHTVGYAEHCDVSCKDSELSKVHFRVLGDQKDRFHVSSNVESRLKYTA